MARTVFYGTDAELVNIEHDIEQWFFGDETDFSLIRIEVIEDIHEYIKEQWGGTFWNELNNLDHLNGEDTDDEIIDVSRMLNPRRLKNFENNWVMERIYQARWKDGGEEDASAMLSQFEKYEAKRKELQRDLKLMFDTDDDDQADEDYPIGRLARA